jgi:hypothetical protein
MSVHSLVLLDLGSSLRDAITGLVTNLFTLQNAIIALVATLVFAVLGWLIAYLFLRNKETCSMVCSIHFLTVILTILGGLIGAFGLIDHYKGSLITGAGLSLLVLTIPIFILVESFNYVVLGNKHARRHRDLRTPADKRTRRQIVFSAPLALGIVLVGVGLLTGTPGAFTEVAILLFTLWILALGAEIIFWLRARSRRRQLAALPGGGQLDQEQLALLWVSGFSSYRIGRGRTEAVYWEEFTERVAVTEELLLEEEGELDLVQVEEQETVAYATAGGAAVAAGPALHLQHRQQRHPASNRFRRRWGGAATLVLIFVLAAVVCVLTNEPVLIALVFLIPAVYLILYRVRRDNDVAFATETVEKIRSVQVVTVGATSVRAESAAAAGNANMVGAPPPPRAPVGPPPVLRPARPQPVVPPQEEPIILPKEEPEPPTLPSVDRAPAGAAHENPDLSEETILFPGRAEAVAAAGAVAAGQAHENPDLADDTLLIAHKPVAPSGEEEFTVSQLGQYFRGTRFPANRTHLLEAARRNNAPHSLILWLEGLGAGVTFGSLVELQRRHARRRAREARQEETAAAVAAAPVAETPEVSTGEDLSAAQFESYFQGVSFPANRAQLLEGARANNAPSALILWIETLSITIVVVTVVELYRLYTTRQTSAAQQDEEITAVPVPRTKSGKISSKIGIIEFQRYLHGVRYPATREELLAAARANNAPPNMLARLSELEESYTFVNVSDVMLGYAYHRYLRGVHYPATRAELLEHAQKNGAPEKFIARLNTLSEEESYATLADVMRHRAAPPAGEEVEVEEDEEEGEETLTPTPAGGDAGGTSPAAAGAPAPEETVKADSRIKITEFQHHLRGVHYPANRAQLLEQARANNAPPNMIARLEELPEHHEFKTPGEVMRGYAHLIQDDEEQS